MPFRYPNDRRIEFFNHVVTLAWCYHMFLFTAFVPYPEIRYNLGYLISALVTLSILVNFAYVNIGMHWKLKKLWRKITSKDQKSK
jgi:hypothetical protein